MTYDPKRTEWRINKQMSNLHRVTYYDLYIDNMYQHTWICHDKNYNLYRLCTYDEWLGNFPSFSQAEDFLTASHVVRRFQRAYGHFDWPPTST